MTSVSGESHQAVGTAPTTPLRPAREPLPRRSFLTGKVLDPELHPSLRTRLSRAMRGR